MSSELAITNCRVSSDEQLLNNSLNRQAQIVLDCAKRLNVTIPNDGQWAGSVSSKKGTNLNRKDIREMLDYCKKHKAVKFLIVDEPDRFMRSIDEAMYLEMEFRIIGVRIWYASDDVLNGDDMTAKLMKFMKYFIAEGSNEERQRKSINGQVQAIREGRYPFRPKFGYRKGSKDGVHEIDELSGLVLKNILSRITSHLVTPSEALKELNASECMDGRAKYKMDKFRNIITDSYYAGIVEMDKQVKARNENGLHEPLITMKQHKEIVRIMNGKEKSQSGPRKNGNPDFPLNNILFCSNCNESSTINRFVGFKHTNGVTEKVYMRYRCRGTGCGKYLHSEFVHSEVESLFTGKPMTELAKRDLKQSLEMVWRQSELASRQNIIRLEQKLKDLRKSISNQVDAITDPDNKLLVDEIRASIETKKKDVAEIETQIENLQSNSSLDKQRFMDFSLDYVDNLATHFFELSRDKQLLCKQLVFPAGFWVDENEKVYTPEISELYRLATRKKDTEVSQKSLMVRVKRL